MDGKVFCPKCRKIKDISRHHIFPQRHFAHSPILHMCRSCHTDLERLIPFELQPDEFYLDIVRLFLASPG